MSEELVVAESHDPYVPLIKQFVNGTFPSSVQMTKCEVFEAITREILGSGKTRFGPLPSPESQVSMRQVIAKNVEEEKSIPFLIPWGSEKPDNKSSIDIAEICGLKTLKCLQERVKQFYAPGIQANIRVEDTTGYFAFRRSGEAAIEGTKRYTRDFVLLIDVLDYDFIKPKPESYTTTLEEFEKKVEAPLHWMNLYLKWTDIHGIDKREECWAFMELKQMGWTGEVPQEQRNYYQERYKHLYNCSDDEAREYLAEYLATALVRYQMGITGAEPEWGKDYLQINFVPPIPGAPKGLTNRIVHYRTIPENITKNHGAPWRMKGFLKMGSTEAKPSIASWKEEKDYNSQTLELKGTNGTTVLVQTDYIVED